MNFRAEAERYCREHYELPTVEDLDRVEFQLRCRAHREETQHLIDAVIKIYATTAHYKVFVSGESNELNIEDVRLDLPPALRETLATLDAAIADSARRYGISPKE